MKRKIELLLSVAVIAFATFLVIGFIRAGLAPWDHPLLPQVARAGDTLPAIAGFGVQAGKPTLVMAMRRGCEYCEASMPFYKKLAALERDNALTASLLAVLPDNETAAKAFLDQHALELPFTGDVPLAGIHVAGTPTLILAGPNRKILRVWVGELTPVGQQEVLDAIAGAPVAAR